MCAGIANIIIKYGPIIKKKKKKKKKPPALPYLKISCYSNTTIFFFGLIAEYALSILSSNEWAKFWPEPMKFLVNMLKHSPD